MRTRMTTVLPAAALTIFLFGCDEPKPTPAEETASAPPATASTPPAQPAAATASASAEAKKPSHPCPEGSTGDGTAKKPCMAEGTTRIMEAQWTGKIDDGGPAFRVTNKAKLEILYGNIIVYFYDKDGKQLEVPGPDKRPKLACGGNIFAGPMKAGEKAVLTFSCVKKKHVPEGTAAIEAELQTVGFTGEDGKTSDTFWRNDDLVPDERPKGGIK